MSDLSFHVHQFVPDAAGAELAHRIALLKARDYAAALRSRTPCEHSISLAAYAHEVAGDFVFASVDEPALKLAVIYCRAVLQAALAAETLERCQ
tara:strand:- start:21537 stop:21818 length:282 start_codon:yes stop_codon:yes gene_type:complete